MPYKDQIVAKAYHIEYARRNSAKAVERVRLWRLSNPDRAKEQRIKQRPSKAAYQRAYAKANQDKIDAYKKRCHGKILEVRRAYRLSHRHAIRSYMASYNKKRRESDPLYRLTTSLRTRINKAIRRDQKSGSAVRDLGCSIAHLKVHLELLFSPGMTWQNWGEWHIDHKVPLSKFDLSDRRQFLAACHYTNLQPLWAEDNLRKGGKLQ